MHNAGQQYGQGGASSHQGAPYGHSDSSSSTGSITSSLRQFRKKDAEKQQINESGTSVSESHVARVAPHNHYPPRPNECYRYPAQFPDYSLSPQVKYSEISDAQPQEPISPSVIQKVKGMDVCNVQQPHMKQAYPDHLNGQQSYAPEQNLHVHPQYLQKDPQVYKPESQYFPKEPQYHQQQIQKYNMPTQIRKYPTENDFLSKLRRIHPSMARSIMSDHHLQESQASYQPMDQNRMYPPQNQRYVNYPTSLQSNPYPHGYMPPQHYSNYPSSCSYTRPPQAPPRFPPINPHERSLSPRRGYADNLPMPYAAKISPNYAQYNAPEYSQHYQHRRAPPQEYYQQHCRNPQYLPHQMAPQEMSENRVTVSDSIKQYIENWADEETASEMNQLESNRLCKENLRVRDDQSTETVYMINASELQYLENGIPLVTSENGIPLVASENGQYIIKSGVSIDNSTGMVRIVDKTSQVENPEDRVVNLHIVDSLKPDCMLASKPNVYADKPRVVIHQNTVIQPGLNETPKVGSSLPVITDGDVAEENVFKKCRETVDKNCSPINVEQMEHIRENTVICPTRPQEEETEDTVDKLKNMPIIDLLAEEMRGSCDEQEIFAETPQGEETNETKEEVFTVSAIMEEKQDVDDDVRSKSGLEEFQKLKSPQAEVDDVIVQAATGNSEEESDTIQARDENSVEEVVTRVEPAVDNMESRGEIVEKLDEIVEEKPTVADDVVKDETIKEEIAEQKRDVDNLETVEDKVNNLPSPTPEETRKVTNRRTKRIFSVDDIINNIGNNIKSNKELIQRRHSLQLCKEFLEKEVEISFILKEKARFKTTENIDECENEPEVKPEDSEGATRSPKQDQIVETLENSEENLSKGADSTDDPLLPNEPIFIDTLDTKVVLNKMEEPDVLMKQTIEVQNEIQYRNAIRVEENSVLLQIAGELVEISVNSVNGKKVITVVPLSDSTVVDFNDNYESLDHQCSDQMKPDDLESIDEVIPDADVIESTSEIIIGMDISLEEEIKLDLEKPPVLCTKAAKKAYENDLQIPSITTSEDINDGDKTDSYFGNDKVSSSKEQQPKEDSSKTEGESRKLSKDSERAKKVKKVRRKDAAEEEEFVPFKDLVKARKLKKLKLQQTKSDNVSADSTNKVDQEDFKLKKSDSEEANTKEYKLKTVPNAAKEVEEKAKEDASKINNCTCEKPKVLKKVSFGRVDYKEPDKPAVAVGNRRLEDPRLKSKSGVIAPSVSEILKENEGVENGKRKLSLQEYNNRKRKLYESEKTRANPSVAPQVLPLVQDRMHRVKMPRPKSLDDLKPPPKPKELAKRKLSLEVTSSKPNSFDWEETQSPKTNPHDCDKRLSEFSGLINNNKSKIVIDINDFHRKPVPSENSQDEILQNYKEQVDSKLSSLNIQIPRVANPFSNPETNNLMQRFLRNEKITIDEMEKIKRIISYKRLVQQLNKIKSPDLPGSPLSPSYEIRKTACPQKDMKLHLKKVPERKKKKRFRNLYSESTSGSDSDCSDVKKNAGDYSVVQSNCVAAGVPKLIIKRKTEMPLPVVRLERLDLGLLVNKKRKLF